MSNALTDHGTRSTWPYSRLFVKLNSGWLPHAGETSSYPNLKYELRFNSDPTTLTTQCHLCRS